MTQMLLPLKPFMCNQSICPHREVCAQACQLCRCVPATPRQKQQPGKEERTTRPGWDTHHAPQGTLLSWGGSVEVWEQHVVVAKQRAATPRHSMAAATAGALQTQSRHTCQASLGTTHTQHTQWARLGQCRKCWASVPPDAATGGAAGRCAQRHTGLTVCTTTLPLPAACHRAPPGVSCCCGLHTACGHLLLRPTNQDVLSL